MRQLQSRRFRRTILVCVFGAALLGGIGLAHTGWLLGWSWFLLAAVTMMLVLRKRNLLTLLAVALCGLTLGWCRGSVFMIRLDEYSRLYNQKVTIVGTATIDGVYNDKSQFVFALTNARLQSGGRQLIGTIYVSGFGVPAVYRGDEISVSGKMYPGFGAYQASMNYAELHIVAHYTSAIDSIRQRFAAGMQSALPEPLASFGLGLLIGQRDTLPKAVSQALLMVGLTHIIAVSGYNLTILLRAARRLLRRGSKFQSTVASLTFISVFLLLTGSSPSIVRAAIVSTVSLAAWYYGRTVRPLVLLLVAAGVTAYANPLYVWGDASWYLSFLAFYGVLVVAPLLRARLPLRLQHAALAQVALESLCAEALTLPYVLFTFGQVSFVSLLANVLVVTLIPLAMLLSLFAGLAGMMLAPLAGWFAWPARLLLTYMLDVVNLLARVPHIFVQNLALSIVGMIGLYGLVTATTMSLWYKNKRNGAILTDNEMQIEGA